MENHAGFSYVDFYRNLDKNLIHVRGGDHFMILILKENQVYFYYLSNDQFKICVNTEFFFITKNKLLALEFYEKMISMNSREKKEKLPQREEAKLLSIS